ncbi:DUF3566 domain-containing protein [Streptomyces sp. NPDC002513]
MSQSERPTNSGQRQPGEDTATPYDPPSAHPPAPGTTEPHHPHRPTTGRCAADGPPERRDRQASPPAGHEDDGVPEASAISAERRRRWPPVTGRAPQWRKVRLRISQADPWSVMTTSLLVSAGLGLCTIVAAAVVTIMLSVLGQEPVASLGWETTLGLVIVIVAAEVALTTALATLVAFLFNWSSGVVGGVEMTLADEPPAQRQTEADAAPDEDGRRHQA